MELTADTEADIWERIIEGAPNGLSSEAARYLMALGFSAADHRRMAHLASKSNEGTLSDGEMKEYKNYVHVGQLMTLLQAKARLSLQKSGVVV